MQAVSEDLASKFEEFRAACRNAIPKVDLHLVIDLLQRKYKEPNKDPLYTIEVFTTERVDPEYARQYIISYTGNAPAIYDRGTHYVTNQRLNLDVLKMISDKDNVKQIKGYYSGEFASIGPASDVDSRDHY